MDAKQSRSLYLLALLLSAVAGGVDALGWMTLHHVFTSHMSGNSVGLSVYLAMGDWGEVAKRVAVICDFLVGLAVGSLVATIAHRRKSQGGFSSALTLEAAILLALLLVRALAWPGANVPPPRHASYFVLLALPALAMGIQSATLRRVEPAHARTTYVTGVLTRFVENLVAWSVLVWDRRRLRRQACNEEAVVRKRIGVLASIWTAFAVGGTGSAVFERIMGWRAFAIPLALLVVAIVLDRSLARAGIAGAGPEEG